MVICSEGVEDMNSLLNKLIEECRPYTNQGHVATYIPELANANADAIGICIVQDAKVIGFAGEYTTLFTMQSVVKPIILLQALMDSGIEKVRALVGVEATGKPFDAFNYSDQALTGAHINPMINTGAIALCTLIHGDTYAGKFARLLDMTRKLAGNPTLDIDPAVYHSECETGNKNRALGYMLKAYGMVSDPVEEILDCYFRACSILVSCKDLARISLVFANHGLRIRDGVRLFPIEYGKYVNATMATCGMYDGSGRFAVEVGVPTKSGVGGGLMAPVYGRCGIGIYGPALDQNGNCIAGCEMMKHLSREMGLHMFQDRQSGC